MASKFEPKLRVWSIRLDEADAKLTIDLSVFNNTNSDPEVQETQHYNLKVIPLASAMEQIVDMLYPRKTQQLPMNSKPR